MVSKRQVKNACKNLEKKLHERLVHEQTLYMFLRMSIGLAWKQVKCLLYKTYLQRRRGLGCTCCELIAPVALAFILFVLPKLAGLEIEVYVSCM